MIPQKLVIDSMMDKPKAFQEIKHSHDGKPTRLESKQCDRCHFDIAEQSLIDKIKQLKPTDKTKDKAGKVYTFKEIRVHRGRFDDCVAWDIIWS